MCELKSFGDQTLCGDQKTKSLAITEAIEKSRIVQETVGVVYECNRDNSPHLFVVAASCGELLDVSIVENSTQVSPLCHCWKILRGPVLQYQVGRRSLCSERTVNCSMDLNCGYASPKKKN